MSNEDLIKNKFNRTQTLKKKDTAGFSNIVKSKTKTKAQLVQDLRESMGHTVIFDLPILNKQPVSVEARLLSGLMTNVQGQMTERERMQTYEQRLKSMHIQ